MSQEKIEKLTPEQEALIPVYREKWRKIALSTEPIDREKAAEAVKATYSCLGFKLPEIIFTESPYTGLNILDREYCKRLFSVDSLEPKLLNLVISPYNLAVQFFPDELIRKKNFTNIYNEISSLIRNQLTVHRLELESIKPFPFLDDIFSPGYISNITRIDFLVSVFQCKFIPGCWENIRFLFESCGNWIYPCEEIAIICDRPRILSFDNQQRLHAEGAPAIQFADGYSLYAYHGVTLPEKYGHIHPNQWQTSWLLEEENAELRRVLIQGIGYERIASELGAIELDSFQEYSLLKIDTNIDGEPIYMLKMTCPSTGYIHVLRVPPDVRSAREAIRWVNWGVDPEEFAVQT